MTSRSIWDTPIGDLHGTWFVLGVLVTLFVIATINLIKAWRKP